MPVFRCDNRMGTTNESYYNYHQPFGFRADEVVVRHEPTVIVHDHYAHHYTHHYAHHPEHHDVVVIHPN
jgi:hypothetical protein